MEEIRNQKPKGLDFMMNIFDNFDYEELMEVMEHFFDDELSHVEVVEHFFDDEEENA